MRLVPASGKICDKYLCLAVFVYVCNVNTYKVTIAGTVYLSYFYKFTLSVAIDKERVGTYKNGLVLIVAIHITNSHPLYRELFLQTTTKQ